MGLQDKPTGLSQLLKYKINTRFNAEVVVKSNNNFGYTIRDSVNSQFIFDRLTVHE